MVCNELRIGLAELLCKAQIEHNADFRREGVRLLSQALLEMEVEEHVGAARHERSPERTGQRNGYTATEVGTRGLEPRS
jgi:putative transposase